MARLSEVVESIYKKYLPKVREVGIVFDVDFPDTTVEVEDTERVGNALDKSVRSAISRTKRGEIKISYKKGSLIVSDTGHILSKSTCNKLSTEHIKVKSRVGFGTTVTIK